MNKMGISLETKRDDGSNLVDGVPRVSMASRRVFVEQALNRELNPRWWLLLEQLQRVWWICCVLVRQLKELFPVSLSTPMWPTFILFGTRISSAIVLPFAAVIGTVGYFVEKQLSSRPKSIPYLDTSVHDDRMRRQMEVELDPEYKAEHTLKEEKKRIVPESSLLLNTGRSGAAQHG